jgi:hypothetical protein
MRFAARFLLICSVLLVFVIGVLPASAHEGRDIGPYAVEFGWRVEPAYAQVYNGPEIFIHDHETEAPVEGAEATLQLEVSLGDQTKTLPLYPVWQDPGHYTADLTPMRPGDYSFHLTGTIGDTTVDEVFTSADGEFGSVEPASDIQFPASEVDAAALQQQIADLQAQIADLQAQIDALKGNS